MDPDGCSVNVKRLEDKTFEVIGGELNDDLNIYEFTQDDVGEYTIKGENSQKRGSRHNLRKNMDM